MLGRPWKLLRPLLVLALPLGCGSSTNLDKSSKSCATDGDCAPTQTCEVRAPGPRPAVVAPPCFQYSACTTDAQCSTGSVCVPATEIASSGASLCPPKVCASACPGRPCRSDEVCQEDGHCALLKCDQPNAAACADHWRCDPAAAANEPTTYSSGASETDDPIRAVQRGCVRKRCNEDGGYVCTSNWECDPARSLEPSGCVAIPCDELGHCSDDTYFICQPTSSAQRPGFKDAFGCSQRNCEEGYTCNYDYNGQNYGYCDPTAASADEYGCRKRGCTEVPSACVSGSYRCEPQAANADPLGCVPVSCEDGYVCQDGWTCAVGEPGANVWGCVPVAMGTGGSSGTGGAGTGGAGTGGIGAGGSSGAAGSIGSGATGGASTGGTGGTGAKGAGGASGSGATSGSGGSSGSSGGSAGGSGGTTGGSAGTSGSGGITGMCVDR